MIIRHDIDPNLYLIDPAQFPAVVAVDSFQEEVQIAYDQIDELLKPSLTPLIQTPEYRTRYDGMGMLIRPDWVLSAAHVATELAVGKGIEFGSSIHSIKQIVLHPQFENFGLEKDFAEHDIALLQLDKAVEGVSPLPLYRKTDELEKIVTFVGRGDFGTGLIGPDAVDGKMRMATNQVEQVDEQWLVFKFDGPPECTELEGISGPGDSGGPALLMTDEGWAIAGISSGNVSNLPSGNLGLCRYGTMEYYARVSGYLDWIESVIE